MKYCAIFFDWGDTLHNHTSEGWVEPMIKRLYTSSYRLAIISNTHRYQDAYWIKNKLAKIDCLPEFECVISSATYGVHKPDIGIFKKALKFMELDPTKVVMIGDSEHCDGAGRLLGMSYLKVESNENWSERLYQLLEDQFPRTRKLSRIVEYSLTGDKLITTMKHLSEAIESGDTILLDQNEYLVKEVASNFTKEDILNHDNRYCHVEFRVVPVEKSIWL